MSGKAETGKNIGLRKSNPTVAKSTTWATSRTKTAVADTSHAIANIINANAAKGTGKVAKVTAKGAGKATVITAKGAGKGSLFLARGAGRAAVRRARKTFPREEGESVKEYRIRMAKLGFKVSLWTGSIVATTYGSVQAQKIALAFKTYELSKGAFDIGKAIQEHLEEADPAPETFSSINDGLKKLGFVLLVVAAIGITISFATTIQF